MPGETNSDFSRAIERLTIFELWREAGLPGVPAKDGQYKSPFREERSASFSVLGGGKGFHDFGTGEKGGLKDFAALAFPGKSADELRELMIDLAGTRSLPAPKPGPAMGPDGKIVPFDPKAPPAAGPTIVPPDPRLVKAAKTIERNARLRAAEAVPFEEREEQLRARIDEKRIYVPEWPDFVRDRYLEGVANLAGSTKRMQELAEIRGWPLQWVEELLNLELLSFPWERWAVPGQRFARRQKALRVDYPVIVTNEEGGTATLRAVGYHQRFFKPAHDGQEARKGWLYVPSFPKATTRSDFENAIVQCGLDRKLQPPDKTHSGDGFIPPLPFVIGDLVNTRTIVLLEGQWDAITFYGACGWFHDTAAPAGVAVFGIRGAQGMDVFLGYWGRWLRANRPLCWVIADNDNAGRTWREAPAAAAGMLQPPGLAERLEANGCRQVMVSWLKKSAARPGDKDFNDYYRWAKPDAAAMHRMMQRVGVLDAVGGLV